MSEYDQTFDPNILIGHCDLISRFSDFALYLGSQMVYEQTSFKVCLRMTRPLTGFPRSGKSQGKIKKSSRSGKSHGILFLVREI